VGTVIKHSVNVVTVWQTLTPTVQIRDVVESVGMLGKKHTQKAFSEGQEKNAIE
jgi:hypothetical protein